MTGIDLRMKRLFKNDTLFLAALDHGQYMGVPPGLEKIERILHIVEDAPFDGVILNPGMVRTLKNFDTRKSLIMRVSHSGTIFSNTGADNRLFLQPEDALCLGADAVIVMVILGQPCDVTSLHEMVSAINEYHKFGIPIIAEVLPAKAQDSESAETIAGMCRIAAELGADIIKTCYTKDFEIVVKGCPIPVIIAGGPRGENLLDQTSKAIQAGARGLAVGRNFYQHENPFEFARSISLVLKRVPQ